MKAKNLLSENQWHQSLAKHSNVNQSIVVNIPLGDDGCVINPQTNKLCLVKDLSVEGTHFKREWSNYTQIIRKCLVSNLSDLFSMGANPHSWLVGLVLTQEDLEHLVEFDEILSSLSQEFSLTLLGGDTTKGESLVVSITALGNIEDKPFLRSNAHVGDLIYLSGKPGLSQMGLNLLEKGEHHDASIDYHLNPSIDLQLQLELLKLQGRVSAMDLSDGLIACLKEISSLSGVGVLLNEKMFKYPEYTESLSHDEQLTLFLNSGEEYFSVYCLPASYTLNEYLSSGRNFYQIGRVVIGNSIEMTQENGIIYTLNENGFSHF